MKTVDYLEARELIRKGHKLTMIHRNTGGDNHVYRYYIKDNQFHYEYERVSAWGPVGNSHEKYDDIEQKINSSIREGEKYDVYDIN